MSLALQGKFLTTGPPGKSQEPMLLEQATGGPQRHFSSQPLRVWEGSPGPHPSCLPFPTKDPSAAGSLELPNIHCKAKGTSLGPSGFPPTQRFGEAKQGRVPVGGSVGLMLTWRFWRGGCGQLRQGKTACFTGICSLGCQVCCLLHPASPLARGVARLAQFPAGTFVNKQNSPEKHLYSPRRAKCWAHERTVIFRWGIQVCFILFFFPFNSYENKNQAVTSIQGHPH